MAYVLTRCLLHRAHATQFNKSCRSASNVTMLVGLQTLASQPRSSGWLSQPRGHWHLWTLATAADSWVFIDWRTQTRAECKHPIDASMYFWLVTELHASLITSLSISIGTYPAESREHLCFAPLRHYRNKSRFSFLTALFSWPTIRSCSKIIAIQLQIHWYWWQVLPKPLQKVVCIVIFVRYFHKDNNDI